MTPLMQKCLNYIEENGASVAEKVANSLGTPVLQTTIALKRLVKSNHLQVHPVWKRSQGRPIFSFALKEHVKVLNDEIINGVRFRKYEARFASGYGI
jgi:predicted ArsR family transcriptional regulator